MKFKNIKLLFLALLIAGLHSCSKDEAYEANDPLAKDTFEVSKQSIEHQALFEYARLLSIAINKHDDMNNLLQEQALQLEKAGYYEQEFFVGMQGKSEMKGFTGQSLNDIVASVEGKSQNADIKEFLNVNPGMSVLLAGDRKTPVFSNRVYVDNNFDDRNPMEIVHFYVDGVRYTELLSEDRYEKSFVVRNSEVYMGTTLGQLDKNDSAKSVLFKYDDGRSVVVNAGSILTPNSKLYTFEDPLLDGIDDGDGGYSGGGGYTGGGSTGGGTTGGGTTSGCNETCERDCENGTENLWRFRTTDDYDGFLAGKGEWFFLIIWGDDSSYTMQNGAVVPSGSGLGHLRTGEITGVKGDDSWHYANFSSIIWNPTAGPNNAQPDGNRMKVVCFESDGGRVKNFETKLKFEVFGISVEQPINITINDGDDIIGEYLVEYCHDIGSNGFMYRPAGAVDVQHNER